MWGGGLLAGEAGCKDVTSKSIVQIFYTRLRLFLSILDGNLRVGIIRCLSDAFFPDYNDAQFRAYKATSGITIRFLGDVASQDSGAFTKGVDVVERAVLLGSLNCR